MRYYVYALIDPTNNNLPFYIGKGLDNRLQSHFKEATANNKNERDFTIVGCDTKSIMQHAGEGFKEPLSLSPKLQKIKELITQGFNHTYIARIVARNLNESTALAVEACLIKSVYGSANSTNILEEKRYKWNYGQELKLKING